MHRSTTNHLLKLERTADPEPEDLVEILQRELGQKYEIGEPFEEGGTRWTRLATWGPGEEVRVIKGDKPISQLTSPRALRHVGRGYNTTNDLKALAKLKDPEAHNVTRLLDFADLSNLGLGTVTVEPHFNGRTLESLVREQGPLSTTDVREVFKQVIEGERYLIEDVGIYHRDLSAFNVLVNNDGKTPKVRITDLANFCNVGEPTPKAMPTGGKHWITDPFDWSTFTGKERAYDIKSELYAVGTNLFFALTGNYAFEANPDEGTMVDGIVGRSLLDHAGHVDPKRYEKSLEKAIDSLPKEARRFGSVIKRCLTSDMDARYDTVNELAEEFEKASKPTFIEKLKQHKKKAIAAGLTGLTLLSGMGIAGGTLHQRNLNLEAQVVEAEKYQVGGEFDGHSLEIRNNLVSIDANLTLGGKSDNRYPKDRFVRAEPGEKMFITVYAEEIARPRNNRFTDFTSALGGRIYFEGYEGKEFSVYPMSADKSKMDSAEAPIGSSWQSIIVPEGIEDGTQTLVVELDAPEKNDKHVTFINPGKVIAKKKNPCCNRKRSRPN